MVALMLGVIMAQVGEWQYNPIPDEVQVVAISPDQKLLAAGVSHGRVFLVDLATGKIKEELSLGHPYQMNSVSFSPSGRYLCASSLSGIVLAEDNIYGELILYDLSVNKQKFRYSSEKAILKAAFFPAEDGLAVVTKTEVMQLDLTGKIEAKTTIPSITYLDDLGVAGSPATVYFARGDVVTLWEPKNKRLESLSFEKALLAADPVLNRVAYADNGKVATMDLRPPRKTKAAWASLKVNEMTLPQYDDPAAAFSKDGKHLFLAMREEGDEFTRKVIDWDLAADKEAACFRRSERNCRITAFAISEDLVVLATVSPYVEIWDRKTRKLQKRIDLDPCPE